MADARPRQNKLLLYFIILLGLVGGYIFYSSSVPGSIEAPKSSDLDRLKNAKIDFAILNNEKYRSLKIFGEMPVNPGSTGKPDLFSGF